MSAENFIVAPRPGWEISKPWEAVFVQLWPRALVRVQEALLSRGNRGDLADLWAGARVGGLERYLGAAEREGETPPLRLRVNFLTSAGADAASELVETRDLAQEALEAATPGIEWSVSVFRRVEVKPR